MKLSTDQSFVLLHFKTKTSKPWYYEISNANYSEHAE